MISGSGNIELAIDFAEKLKHELDPSKIQIDIQSNLKDNQVKKILCDSKFLLNFHEWEAFGLSLVEALQCGCQLLVPNTTPLLMQIHKSSFIRFRDKSNYLDNNIVFFDEIDTLLKGTKTYNSKKMSAFYIKKFSWENCVKNICNL